ncbi:LysR family transcriptional regulator [Novosphingobium profundi]|uniref:LysR family transcriptional regulator n=1 Tax=Novosphingobium profundi TaxID=1774954 RepID=UPI001BDA83C4|nr:LysR family transcriptional regulator [Novosphingobium profundi]MBT0669553.1 LysR family transcriptional regulator [Novosphingobium profundi]
MITLIARDAPSIAHAPLEETGVNITKLERLIAVYEAGSFRKAARISGVSQPALTWSVRQLEESLNIALFVRGPRGIKPTEACERLIVRARLIVNEQARLVAEVEDANRRQFIDLGIHPVLASHNFAQALSELRRSDPDVVLQVIDGYSAPLQEMLRQGRLDVAFCAPASEELETGEFEFEPLLRQRYSIVGHRDHPVFAQEPQASPGHHDWAQVAVPNVLYGQDDAADLIGLLTAHGLAPERAFVRTSSMHLIRSLVKDGGLLAMLPDDLVREDLAVGSLRAIEASRIEAPPLGLLTVAGSYRNRALRRLMSLFRQQFRDFAAKA